MAEIPLDGPIPGESLTSGIKQLPYDRPPQFVDNKEIQERLWKTLSKPAMLRQINALYEVGTPVDELAAQIAHGMFREGKIAAQNAVMVLPSLTVMLYRIGEAFGNKMRISTKDKHDGVSKAEIRAAIKKARGSDSSVTEKADMNNKTMRGFKAVMGSQENLTKNADNVGFLSAAKEKM